jgi:hypothetical protein
VGVLPASSLARRRFSTLAELKEKLQAIEAKTRLETASPIKK